MISIKCLAHVCPKNPQTYFCCFKINVVANRGLLEGTDQWLRFVSFLLSSSVVCGYVIFHAFFFSHSFCDLSASSQALHLGIVIYCTHTNHTHLDTEMVFMRREDPRVCSSMLPYPDKEHLFQIMWSRNSLFSQQICHQFYSYLTEVLCVDKQKKSVWQIKVKKILDHQDCIHSIVPALWLQLRVLHFSLEKESGKQKGGEMIYLTPHLSWFEST